MVVKDQAVSCSFETDLVVQGAWPAGGVALRPAKKLSTPRNSQTVAPIERDAPTHDAGHAVAVVAAMAERRLTVEAETGDEKTQANRKRDSCPLAPATLGPRVQNVND